MFMSPKIYIFMQLTTFNAISGGNLEFHIRSVYKNSKHPKISKIYKIEILALFRILSYKIFLDAFNNLYCKGSMPPHSSATEQDIQL